MSPSQASTPSTRILLLEDAPDHKVSLERALEGLSFPFDLHTVESRDSFIESLKKSPPDLVLYHYHHQSLDQLEALQLTRGHSGHTPFIIIDGVIDQRAAIEYMRAGASDIIPENTLERLPPAIEGALQRKTETEELVRATGALSESDQVLRLIVENVSDLIAVLDLRGRRIYNSPSYIRLFGNALTFKGTDSFNEVHSDDRSRVRRAFEDTVRTGAGQRLEYRLLLRDGTVRHIESQGNVIKDNAGNPVCVVVVSRDITERRLADETLRKNEERFRSLIENSSDAIALVDPDGTITYAGPSTERVLGYTSEEFQGVNGLSLVHADDVAAVRRALDDLVRHPQASVRIQYRYRHKLGAWRWIEAVGTNLLDDPTVEAVVVNYRDITESREAIDALRKSDERYRTFVEQSSEGIWRFEFDEPLPLRLPEQEALRHLYRHAHLAQCNDAMARMYGYRRAEDMTGIRLPDLLPPDDPKNTEYLRSFIASGYRLVNAESRQPDMNGTLRYYLNNIVGIVENDRLVRAWGTHKDITEQKEAEGKVTILAHALRSISEGVYLTDLDNRILFANEALVRMYGYSEPELLGAHISILYSSRNAGEVIREIRASTLGTGWSGELTHRRRDGSELLVSLSTSVVRDDSGDPMALMGVARDITDRKRAEHLQDAVYRIAQSADIAPSLDELYQAVHAIISEVMPAANFYIALYDAVTDLLTFPYFVDEVDVPLPPMKPGKGLTAHVLRTGRSLLCTEDVWDDLVRAGDVELVGVPSPIWLGVPLIVANRTIGVMVVQHYSDAAAYGPNELHMLEFVSSQVARVIERKRNEVALRESEERYRTMFEDDLTGDFISNPDGKLQACNPAFARIFGFTSVEEALLCNCALLHKDAESRDSLFEAVRQQKKLEYHEMELRRKDGLPIHVVANLIGAFDQRGELVSVKGYLFDDTERKRLEDQLLQAQKMEAVGQLASGIAHDFNNVMGVALTAAQMIETTTTEESPRRFAKMIEDATMRGTAIAKQLLQFSRAEVPMLSPISIAHIVGEVKKILDHSFPKTIEIRMVFNLKQGVILGDEGQIHQLLLNLCINARDAMCTAEAKDGKGLLTLSVESVSGEEIRKEFGVAHADEYAVVRVTDTGTGISPEIQRRMFDPFFTTKEIGRGTGLGLSIVHGIVRSHHGQIRVDSRVGEGTTFSVFFPTVAQQTAPEDTRPGKPIDGRGETILVIEDEEILRLLMRELLQRAGYRVLEARDGEEGVRVYVERREEIALVISDMGLPRLSGEQVFNALIAENPAVRVVFSTGFIRDDKRQDLIAAGAKQFIYKPYRAHELLQAIREVLDV